MGDPIGLVSELQNCLQQSISKKGSSCMTADVSWSWVCIKLTNLLSNYPSGVTRAIALAELDNESVPQVRRKAGPIPFPATEKNHCEWSARLKVCFIRVRLGSANENFSRHLWHNYKYPIDTPEIAHLVDSEDDERHILMYLHRKFYDTVHILNTHTVRLTCCRLVTSGVAAKSGPKQQLCLLPTEHVAILVGEIEAKEKDNSFTTRVESESITEPTYIENIQAKVADIGETEVLYSPDGTSYHRLVVQLSNGERNTIPLVLWDSYLGFARLFDKGDTLFLERPYARPSSSSNSGWADYCLEFGPATLLYVLPYVPEQEMLLSQHPTQLTVTVKKTDDGKLDFLSYPERLCVDDLLAKMINGVLMVQCVAVGKRERVDKEEQATVDAFRIKVQDSTGSVFVTITDSSFKLYDSIHQFQWLLMTGLSSQHKDGEQDLSLSCDLRKGGQIVNVSALPGLLMSSDLYSTVTLEEAQHLPPLSQFIVPATLQRWLLTGEDKTSSDHQLLRPIHVSCRSRGNVNEETGQMFCQTCGKGGLSLLKGSQAEEQKAIVLEDHWKWDYDVKAVLRDNSGTSINVQFTTSCAEVLLQRSPQEIIRLSMTDGQDFLTQLVNTTFITCITKTTTDSYQVNLAVPIETQT